MIGSLAPRRSLAAETMPAPWVQRASSRGDIVAWEGTTNS